jgi:hypothetical protein
MSVTNENLTRLRQPFPSSDIKWRVGRWNSEALRGQALPYLDARSIQSRLDDIVGAENWQVEYKSSPLPNGLICRLGILVGDTWVFKEDGAQLDAVNSGNNREIAIKGAYTDAFKRAAVMWGIGRYLYDYTAPWVEIKMRGKDAVLAQDPPILPASMRPEGEPENVSRREQFSLDEGEVAQATPSLQTAALTETPDGDSTASSGKGSSQPAQAAAAQAPAAQAPATPTPTEQVSAAPREASATANASAAPGTASRAPTPTPGPTATATPAVPNARSASTRSQAGSPAAPTRPASAPAAAPAVKPASKPAASTPAQSAAPVAAAHSAAGADELPEGLGEEELKLVKGLLEKIAKPSIPLTMLKNYIEGPKVSSVLSETAKQFIANRMAKRRNSDATA